MSGFRVISLWSTVGLLFVAALVVAGSTQQRVHSAVPSATRPPPMTGVVPGISAPPHPSGGSASMFIGGTEYRTIDGTGNCVNNPTWGSAGIRFLRFGLACYADGASEPAGPDRPSARAISNDLCAQTVSRPNNRGATDFIWMWGQFVDHDLDLAGTADPVEPFPISVPLGDPYFDPMGTGTATIELQRSAYDPSTGDDPDNPREQMNFITAYIDASNVYGSDSTRATWLRTNDGSGRLKTSAGDLLPFNTDGLPNAGGTGPELFLAGDVRANEQVSLTALHTLFVREHNRLADQIRKSEPQLTDDEIYERARSIVGAEMQVITYKEFLPVLLGPGAIGPYQGYDSGVDAGIDNIFATASYRVGHTMLSSTLHRVGADGSVIAEGDLPLRDAFFAPDRVTDGGGIEPLFRGAARQFMQEVDPLIVDEVRNFLFGPPGAGGFDLASLNLQRGRDHGLPTYNEARVEFGVPAVTQFSEITANAQRRAALENAYGDVNKVDLWIGALAEDHVSGALVGPLLRAVLADQFTRLRDGDRFWYESVFSGPQLKEIETTRLADIIRRNTTIGPEVQDNVFVLTTGAVPSVSQWGLTILCLLLVTTGSIILHRHSDRLTA